MFPPEISAWEAIQKVTLITPQVAAEASKILMVRRGCPSGMPSGPPLVHFHPLSVVELGGSSMSPAWLRDRPSLARKEKLWYKIYLHPHPEQGRTPPVESRHWSLSLSLSLFLFSLLQMGANNSSLSPLKCILKNWDRFDPQGLKKTHLAFLHDMAWPRYPLEDAERWPIGGSLKYCFTIRLVI